MVHLIAAAIGATTSAAILLADLSPSGLNVRCGADFGACCRTDRGGIGDALPPQPQSERCLLLEPRRAADAGATPLQSDATSAHARSDFPRSRRVTQEKPELRYISDDRPLAVTTADRSHLWMPSLRPLKRRAKPRRIWTSYQGDMMSRFPVSPRIKLKSLSNATDQIILIKWLMKVADHPLV